MRMLPALVLGMVAVQGIAWAQEPALPEKTYFSQLFPKPTGRNGYEELVLAGDYARTSDLLREAQQSITVPLSAKRAALNDPPVKRALKLMRAGLAKPLTPIHPTITAVTLLPEFAQFRNLARTLLIEQYVLLADGDVQGAIESARDCFKLGIACGADGDILISGLVQVAIDAIGMKLLADHVDQLSARDCERLLAMVLDWLKVPDPSTRILLGEKRYLLETWNTVRADPNLLYGFLSENEDDPQSVKDAAAKRKEIDSLAQNTSAYQGFIDSISARVNAHFDTQLANAQLPPWKRKNIEFKPGNSMEDQFLELLLPMFSNSSDRFVTERANMQMLGIHAAIHRYLWEYNKLPVSLKELKLPNLIEDPFSGEPFMYVKTGERTYEISSAGPYDRGSDDEPPSGKRVPFSLPRKPVPGSQ